MSMDEIIIYTDGTSKDNIGAWGSIILYNGIETAKLSGSDLLKTNNRMELQAVVKTLKSLLYGKLRTKIVAKERTKITVRSDSAYVVNTYNNGIYIKWKMNGWRTNSGEPVKNGDLWEEMFETLSIMKLAEIEIVFEKIKAHSGNIYNDLADKIAKQEIVKVKQRRGRAKKW